MMIDVDWRQPFIDYIREDSNVQEFGRATRPPRQVLHPSRRQALQRGASSGVLMKCVPREEGKGILEEIHKGVCGSKAFRRAFYWPTALGDTEEPVRRCQGCQYFAK
jgi:hypothetical protein